MLKHTDTLDLNTFRKDLKRLYKGKLTEAQLDAVRDLCEEYDNYIPYLLRELDSESDWLLQSNCRKAALPRCMGSGWIILTIRISTSATTTS